MNGTKSSQGNSARPWYKEPWPWILMSGPFLVIVASFVSAWYALSTSDGLVEDDYYKKGLAAEKTIAASQKAQDVNLRASLSLTSSKISVTLKAKDGYQFPSGLSVTLSHPTRAGLDQTVSLPLVDGVYSGPFRLPNAGHWLITIEDPEKSWRLLGNLVLPANGELVIGGENTTPADIRNQR